MKLKGPVTLTLLIRLLKFSFKAFSDHSQLVALIMVSTKSVFINSTSRVIMNFKIKQKNTTGGGEVSVGRLIIRCFCADEKCKHSQWKNVIAKIEENKKIIM